MKSLVSVMTPCFNGESFVHRFFESVVAQTYPQIELFFINDGSDDNTESIALSYKDQFEQKFGKGTFHYIYQSNAGQASAINCALPQVKGKYITWPDSDDWMTPDCIEKKVEYLENNLDKGLVLCATAVVNESNLDIISDIMKRHNTSKEMIFEDLLFFRDIYFAPGGYMARASMFFEMLPQKHIFEGQCGQNWQLLLPIAYKYPCGFMDDVLYFYLERKASHSHFIDTLQKNYERAYQQYETLLQTLLAIDMDKNDKEKYTKLLLERYSKKYFSLAYQMGEPSFLKKEFANLKDLNLADKSQTDAFLEVCHPQIYKIKQIIRNPGIIIRRFLRR